mmetsp:Transcript_75518/g.218113  ORF Transcript_75518/g.218113 Transcript_75518/m.218113 type:complete len:205 (-) Transcript_75518:1473-2087(-)
MLMGPRRHCARQPCMSSAVPIRPSAQRAAGGNSSAGGPDCSVHQRFSRHGRIRMRRTVWTPRLWPRRYLRVMRRCATYCYAMGPDPLQTSPSQPRMRVFEPRSSMLWMRVTASASAFGIAATTTCASISTRKPLIVIPLPLPCCVRGGGKPRRRRMPRLCACAGRLRLRCPASSSKHTRTRWSSSKSIAGMRMHMNSQQGVVSS